MSKDYKLRKIRVLLIEGFTEGELRAFCFDEADFRPVYDQLSSGIGKEEFIHRLIEHAERRTLFETLLSWAKEQNRTKFEEHYPYHNSPINVTHSMFPTPVSTPDPLMNCETELATFERIATGQDTETQLIWVEGNPGMGKSRLLDEYEQLANQNSLKVLRIPLGQQISIEYCIHLIIGCFDPRFFVLCDEFLTLSHKKPSTQWQNNFTRKFFLDLKNYSEPARLAIFFDQYEKADPAFKDWLNQVFVPNIFTNQLLIIVIAGREIDLKLTRKGQRHFSLKGVTVEWYRRYAEMLNVFLTHQEISLFYEALQGEPKRYTEIVRSRATLRGAA